MFFRPGSFVSPPSASIPTTIAVEESAKVHLNITETAGDIPRVKVIPPNTRLEKRICNGPKISISRLASQILESEK